MKIAWETLAAAVLVVAGILFIGRYQISAIEPKVLGPDTQAVYRLDRWTGKVEVCTGAWAGSTYLIECPASAPSVQSTN